MHVLGLLKILKMNKIYKYSFESVRRLHKMYTLLNTYSVDNKHFNQKN